MKTKFLSIASEFCEQFETENIVINHTLATGTKVELLRIPYIGDDGKLVLINDDSFFVVVDSFYYPDSDTMCYHVCHEDDKETREKFGV